MKKVSVFFKDAEYERYDDVSEIRIEDGYVQIVFVFKHKKVERLDLEQIHSLIVI